MDCHTSGGLTFEGFGIPIWAFRFVMLMVFLGFPISLVIAWAIELSPDGIKATKSAQETIRLLENTARHAEGTEAHSKKRNWFSFLFGAAVPTLIFGALALFFYFPQISVFTCPSEPKDNWKRLGKKSQKMRRYA